VAYLGGPPEGNNEALIIAVVDSPQVTPTYLTLAVEPTDLHWSPDGKYIAFSTWPAPSPGGVWIVRPDGSDLRPLSSNCSLPSVCASPSQSGPAWAPDATRLAWSAGQVAEGVIDSYLVVGGRGGGGLTQFQVGSSDYQATAAPQWSPDGSLLLYNARSATDSTVIELRAGSPDGTGAVAKVSPYTGRAAAWRP
jgi:Tol biopolymer transport system component